MKQGIYAIRNTHNGKVYVGSSRAIARRWCDHRWHLRLRIHPNSYLQRSWNHYGGSSFVFEVLEEVADLELLLSREQWWMDHTQSYNREFGYNSAKFAAAPGRGRVFTAEQRARISERFKGKKKSVEHRKKMSDARRGKPSPRTGKPLTEAHKKKWLEGRHRAGYTEEMKQKLREANLGKKYSEETRHKLSMMRKGRKKSEEHRRKIGAANLGRRHTEESNQKNRERHLGKKASEETRRKLSEAHKGRKLTPEQCKAIGDRSRGRKMSEELKIRISETKKAAYRKLREALLQRETLFDLFGD